jgi:hypothetical protein
VVKEAETDEESFCINDRIDTDVHALHVSDNELVAIPCGRREGGR